MQASIRRKLSMAQKVLDFSRTHPSDDAGYAGVVTRLEQALERAVAMDEEAIRTTQDELIELRSRATIRRRMQQQLRHLAAVGRAAAAEHAALTGALVAPVSNAPNRAFIARARVLLERATEHREILGKYALGETFLAELQSEIEEFETAGSTANIDRFTHVGARRDLRFATAECMELVRALDGFNRARFATDPKLLGAWDSASDIFGPIHRRTTVEEETPPPTTGGL